jgi:hypothetical protein
MMNVELSESKKVSRLKTEVIGIPNPDLQPVACGLSLE